MVVAQADGMFRQALYAAGSERSRRCALGCGTEDLHRLPRSTDSIVDAWPIPLPVQTSCATSNAADSYPSSRVLGVADALHADLCQLITPGGATQSKEEYLGGIASGRLDYRVFEASSHVAVRVVGEVGILRYQARIEIHVAGDLDRGLFWHTDYYERSQGQWQAVWSQATRIKS